MLRVARQVVRASTGVRHMSSNANKEHIIKALAVKCLSCDLGSRSFFNPEDIKKLRAVGLNPEAFQQELMDANLRAWDGDPMGKFRDIFRKYGVSPWDPPKGTAVDLSRITWTSK